MVLSDFLDKESLEYLVDPFMRMIDDLTPYYQDRLRQLPPAQRKIVEFLSAQGKPTIIKDISTPCLMSQQTAAKQIGELEAAGFVDRMRFGRNTFCELAEPLMRICIEVKDNRTQHFRLFVEFLRFWFAARELERSRAVPQHNGRPADPDRVHVEKAIRRALDHRRESSVEALPGRLLLGRLLSALAAAGTEPLQAALEALGAVIEPEDFESDEPLYRTAIAGILTVSVRNFGPRHLPQGLAKLRDQLTDIRDHGVVGAILTEFMIESVEKGLEGSLADWERALEDLASTLDDLPDCRIPLEMLEAAVRYAGTGDKRHLLSLPLEKRQLLEEILPSATGERASLN